jgi:hypothetical protein
MSEVVGLDNPIKRAISAAWSAPFERKVSITRRSLISRMSEGIAGIPTAAFFI